MSHSDLFKYHLAKWCQQSRNTSVAIHGFVRGDRKCYEGDIKIGGVNHQFKIDWVVRYGDKYPEAVFHINYGQGAWDVIDAHTIEDMLERLQERERALTREANPDAYNCWTDLRRQAAAMGFGPPVPTVKEQDRLTTETNGGVTPPSNRNRERSVRNSQTQPSKILHQDTAGESDIIDRFRYLDLSD